MSKEIQVETVRELIEKMLTANPEDRMSSSDVVQQLEKIGRGPFRLMAMIQASEVLPLQIHDNSPLQCLITNNVITRKINLKKPHTFSGRRSGWFGSVWFFR